MVSGLIARSEREPADGETPERPPRRVRPETVQRLQIGIAGLIGVLMVVGLASAITTRASQSESTVVPEAEPTAASSVEAPPTNADPLAEAGVVPDLPVASGTPAAPTPAPRTN